MAVDSPLTFQFADGWFGIYNSNYNYSQFEIKVWEKLATKYKNKKDYELHKWILNWFSSSACLNVYSYNSILQVQKLKKKKKTLFWIKVTKKLDIGVFNINESLNIKMY